MRRRVCRWGEEREVKEVKEVQESGVGCGVCATEDLGGRVQVVKAEAELPHSKKRTGNLGLPVVQNFITGSLRFESFLHLWELQLGFRQGFHYESLCVFRCQIASSGHFADQEILGAL